MRAVNVTYSELSDGEEIADVVVTSLTTRQAHDLRLELTQQLCDPDEYISDDVERIYKAKIEELKAFLVTD